MARTVELLEDMALLCVQLGAHRRHIAAEQRADSTQPGLMPLRDAIAQLAAHWMRCAAAHAATHDPVVPTERRGVEVAVVMGQQAKDAERTGIVIMACGIERDDLGLEQIGQHAQVR